MSINPILNKNLLLNQTGQRTLNPDFQSENEQFVALMDSAVNLSGILDLELGKPLSQQQLANLTQDIVWMEEQIVDGKLVLVPVVYSYFEEISINTQIGFFKWKAEDEPRDINLISDLIVKEIAEVGK